MLIDWFTVIAQALNFLILVWLLKRFLYQPILRAIDAREKRIAAQLAEAEAKMVDAEQQRDNFEHKNEAFDRERAALLKIAADEANTERQRLLDEARRDADSLRAKREDALGNEQRALSQEITRWTQQQVFDVTRKTLADLAATSLEERIAEVFIHRLRALSGAAKDELTAALKTSIHAARVRSAFDLPSSQRTMIESAVKESFGAETRVEFETAPDLISGIELSSNGRKLGWSISDYLATLEKSAGELHIDTMPESQSDTQSLPKTEAAAAPESTAVVKPEPKVETKPGLKREPKQGLAQAPSARKADH
jgi:F-type H+-transporting ATPase subunit b